MRKLQPSRALVFVNTRRGTEWVSRNLEGNGIQAAVLSGEVPQKKRQRLLTDFQEGRLHVLIATDVAARGLHIPEVSHVFNFDLPQSGEDYVHRIGRTARAGESGHAVSFACEDTAFYVPEIEEYIETKLPTAAVTSDLLPETARPAPPPRRRQDGAGRKVGDRGKGRSRGGGRRDGGNDRKRRPQSKPSGTKETSSWPVFRPAFADKCRMRIMTAERPVTAVTADLALLRPGSHERPRLRGLLRRTGRRCTTPRHREQQPCESIPSA